MRFDILTLFPEMLEAVLGSSIIGRAREKNIIEVNCVQIRDFAFNKHKRVDDYPYGGGTGMVMQAEPIFMAAVLTINPKRYICLRRGEPSDRAPQKDCQRKSI